MAEKSGAPGGKESAADVTNTGVSGTADDTQVHLQQRLGLPSALGIIVGIIIGSGIFVSPKGVTLAAQSTGLSLVLWVIAGIISLLGALSMAELGTLIPSSGGPYAYFKTVYPSWVAFLYTWKTGVLGKPASQAILSIVCAEYILVPLYSDGCGAPPQAYITTLASSILILLVAINMYNVDWAARVQNVFTAAKVLALGTVAIGGLVMLASGYSTRLNLSFAGSNTNPGQVMLGFYSAMWAYDGWFYLNFFAEEIKRPSRTIPMAIFIGMPTIMGLYLLANISYFTVMTKDELLASPAVGITWAERVIPSVVWIMPIVVAISTFGSCNAVLMSNSRLHMATARGGEQLEILALIHVTKSLPSAAVIFSGLLGLIFVQAGTVRTLLTFLGFTSWMTHGLTMTSLLIMRIRLKNKPRPYKVPLLFPIAVIAFSLCFVVLPIAMHPQIEFLYGILTVLLGLVFYIIFVHFGLKPPYMKSITTFVQLALQVSPASGCNESGL